MKHPVPKKKSEKGRTHRRYADFANRIKRRFENQLNLSPCPKCGEPKLQHHVCQNCGTYNGKQILNKEKQPKKITKIKA